MKIRINISRSQRVALVGVMSLVLALSAAMLFIGCADSSFREATAAKDDSAIDWGGMTAAETRELIERGELDPKGIYKGTGEFGELPFSPIMRVVIARNGDSDVLNALVEHGADVDRYVTSKGKTITEAITALGLAISDGNVAFARRLLELGANANVDWISDAEKAPYIFHALYSSRLSLDIRKEMIDLLLTHGANINAVDYMLDEAVVSSPLMVAMFNSNYEKYPIDYEQLIPYILSQHGVDINLRPAGGAMTAMHMAVWEEDADLIGELARLGGDVNLVAGDGCLTPLFSFVWLGQNMEVFDWLVDHGVDLDYKCPGGKGILDFIAERKDGSTDEWLTSGMMIYGKTTVEEWRVYGDVILARIVELCEAKEYAVCQELDGASHGVTSAAPVNAGSHQ